MLATRLLFFNPPVKFDLIRLRDTGDWWVLDVRLSEQYECFLNFIFVPHNVGYLAFLLEKFDLIRLKDAADW
jgi:hypothetical protein